MLLSLSPLVAPSASPPEPDSETACESPLSASPVGESPPSRSPVPACRSPGPPVPRSPRSPPDRTPEIRSNLTPSPFWLSCPPLDSDLRSSGPPTPPTRPFPPVPPTPGSGPLGHRPPPTPPPHTPGSSLASFSLSSEPLPLSSVGHRRQTSQPVTPVPVKETLHGTLSPNPSHHGQRQLNQYLLLKNIGRGSYGSVDLAKDLSASSHQVYAVKEHSKSRLRNIRRRGLRCFGRNRLRRSPMATSHDELSSSEGMQLVKTEVAIMKKLAHPNIVALREVIDTDSDSLFFVLELCPYGPVIDLSHPWPSSVLDEAKSRNVFQQVVLGIEYLHFNEVLHLDIKPDNVLYLEDPHAVEFPICKIVDFGVSATFQNLGDDSLNQSSGSPGFLAPELCSGNAVPTSGKMVDIWAMGVTLYAVLCGELPFRDSDPLELGRQIMDDPVLVPAHFTRELKFLLNRLLDKSPETRITMMELRKDEWLSAHGAEPLPDEGANLREIDPPTDQEIDQAFKSLKTFATVFKAMSKFRSARKASIAPSVISGSSEDDQAPFSTPRTTYLTELVRSPLGPTHIVEDPPSSERSQRRLSSGLISTRSAMVRTPDALDRLELASPEESHHCKVTQGSNGFNPSLVMADEPVDQVTNLLESL